MKTTTTRTAVIYRLAIAAVALLLAPTIACDDDAFDSSRVIPYERRPLPDPDVGFDAWPPLSAKQQSLQPTFGEVPKTVKAADDIHYVIRLHNPNDDDVSLDPCPTFYSAWGESALAYFENGYLNCPDAPPVIPAGESLRFEMKIDLPEHLSFKSYSGTIIWRLEGGNGQTDSVFSRTVTVSKR